jgi:hypothetical protein
MRVIIYGLKLAISKAGPEILCSDWEALFGKTSPKWDIIFYILAKYRFFVQTGLFAAHANPYHLGAAFTGRPGITKQLNPI